jgi:hypothetical protein
MQGSKVGIDGQQVLLKSGSLQDDFEKKMGNLSLEDTTGV